MHHPTDRIAHTTALVTPVVEHWLEREIAQWVGLVQGSNLVLLTGRVTEDGDLERRKEENISFNYTLVTF